MSHANHDATSSDTERQGEKGEIVQREAHEGMRRRYSLMTPHVHAQDMLSETHFSSHSFHWQLRD